MIRYTLIFVLLFAGCTSPEPPTQAFFTTLERSDLEQLKRHIFWQTDINQTLPNGDNALHIAVRKGNPIFVDLLIDAGAELNKKNLKQLSPIDTALLNGRTRIAQKLITSGALFDVNQSLKTIVLYKVTDRDVYQFLSTVGATVNQPQIEQSSLLNYAIAHNQRLIVKHLIHLGADVNAKDGNNDLPIDLAKQSSEPEILTLLKQNGAKPSPTNNAIQRKL